MRVSWDPEEPHWRAFPNLHGRAGGGGARQKVLGAGPRPEEEEGRAPPESRVGSIGVWYRAEGFPTRKGDSNSTGTQIKITLDPESRTQGATLWLCVVTCVRGLRTCESRVLIGRCCNGLGTAIRMLLRSCLPSSMRHRTLTSSPALWASIPCPRSELRLDLVLASGQSFR